MAESRLVPMLELRAGQSGTIRRVTGPQPMVQRLGEMGVRDGVRVRMFRPGRPCIIRLGPQKLCFRADAAASVLVVADDTVLGPSAPPDPAA